MISPLGLVVALLALLVGLAIGKAWERYKLRDGRWIDRRRARESPHYMLGLNFLVANQVDPAIDEMTKAAKAAGDPLEIHLILGQPVSREGAGRPRDPGTPERCCSGRTCASSNTRTCCSVSASITAAAASSIARSRRSRKCCGSIRRTSTRCSNLEKLHEEQHQWAEAYAMRAEAGGAHGRERRGAAGISEILAFLENELGQAALKRQGLCRGGAAVRGGDRSRPAQCAGASQPRRCPAPGGRRREAVAAWERLIEASPERAYLAFARLESAYRELGAPRALRRAVPAADRRQPPGLARPAGARAASAPQRSRRRRRWSCCSKRSCTTRTRWRSTRRSGRRCRS